MTLRMVYFITLFTVLAIQAKKKRSKPPKAKLKNKNDQQEPKKNHQASHTSSRFRKYLFLVDNVDRFFYC